MGDTRYKTVIDVDLSTDRAEQALQRLQSLADKFASTLTGYQAGGAGSPGQGGAAPNALPGGRSGGGMGAPLAAPNASPSGAQGQATNASLPGGSPAPMVAPGRGSQMAGSPSPAPAAVPGGGSDQVREENRLDRQLRSQAGVAGTAGFYGLTRGISGFMAAAHADTMGGLAAASDTSITAPFSYRAAQERAIGMRQAADTRFQGAGLSAAGGLATAAAFGGPAGLAVAAMTMGFTELFAQDDEQKAAERAAAINTAGNSIAFRMGYVNRLADFQKQNSLLNVLGGNATIGGGAHLGMMPEETVAAKLAFGQSAGFLGAFNGQNVLGMSRSGVGIGAAGAFRGLAAAGAGGVGEVNPEDFIGLARYSRLVGGKAEEYLGAIANATRGLAEKGLTLDIGATEQFLRRLSYSRASGLEQGRAIAGLTGAVGGAREQFISPYARVAQDSMMIEAMRMGGGDDLATMRAFETLARDPEAQRQAVTSATGGGQLATLGFLGMGGIGVDMASELAGLTVGEIPQQRMRVAGGGKLAQRRARHEADMMSIASNDAGAIMDMNYQIQARVMHLSTVMLTYTDLMKKLLDNMSDLNAKVVKVLNEMR